jgi:hypothetical protein
MISRRIFLSVATALCLTVSTLSAGEKKNEHDHHHGPHDGEIVEVGDDKRTHIEIVHDEKAGKLTIYVFGKDMKTAVNIADAPKLNLKSSKGNKQLEMSGKDSQWEATDELLKEEPNGRVQLKLADGKKYNVRLDHHH